MSSGSERPNVVFVITDDQGYGDLGCHGNPVLRTPNLDQMYAESVRLADFHVGPTCAPTRAGLLTGHYANSTGVWHTIGGRSLLRKNEVSMANFFANNGYVTGMFGKWHLGDNYPYRPQDRGFQEVVTHGGGGIGNTPDYWGNKYFDDTYWTQDGYKKYAGYCTDIWFAEALSFIERNRERPFFCYIPTNAPHWPHLVPPSFSDPYMDKVPHRERAKFFGMVECIDHNFGVLRQKLAEWGLSHNTIVIFMTDNGSWGGVDVDAEGFVVNGHNAGMRGRKGSEYDGGHRVPFFLHWPAGGFTEGRDIAQVTANVDVLPTLIELCALDEEGQGQESLNFDGRSLVPLLRDTNGAAAVSWPDRALVTDSQRVAYPVKWKQSSVMTNRWRLVNGTQLYDIKADPEQRNDLAAAYPQELGRLQAAYEAWWAKVSLQYDEEIPITLGDEKSMQLCLNSHDWRNEACDCAWNQNLVRRGYRANGYWEVLIAASGRYHFELCRWPKEEDRPLIEGIPGPAPVALIDMTLETGYGGGVAIPIQNAEIHIGGQQLSSSVNADDKAISFFIDLEAGPTHLQTYLHSADGKDLGAYYVYITRLQPADA